MQEKFELSTKKAMEPQKILEILRNDLENRLFSFSSSEEVIKTITKESFPKDICQKIKILILKIFIDQFDYCDNSKKLSFIRENALSIVFCLHTLDEDPENTKQHFLETILSYFLNEQEKISTPNYASGTDYMKWRKSWREDSLKNFTNYFGFDILMWPDRIMRKFDKDLKTAIKNEQFANDYKDYRRLSTQDD